MTSVTQPRLINSSVSDNLATAYMILSTNESTTQEIDEALYRFPLLEIRDVQLSRKTRFRLEVSHFGSLLVLAFGAHRMRLYELLANVSTEGLFKIACMGAPQLERTPE